MVAIQKKLISYFTLECEKPTEKKNCLQLLLNVFFILKLKSHHPIDTSDQTDIDRPTGMHA